jgi:hypothetical protein
VDESLSVDLDGTDRAFHATEADMVEAREIADRLTLDDTIHVRVAGSKES